MKTPKIYIFQSFIIILMVGFAPFLTAAAYEKEIDNMSKTIADQIAGVGKKKVAVVDFTDLQGSVTELGRFIAEEFSVSLADSGKGFEVVDRTHLQSIIKEHKLSRKGLIDPATARKLGRIAGVEALVTGTLTPLGESVRISVKVLDTETAAVIKSGRGDLAMTNAFQTLMGNEVGGSSGQPISRSKRPRPGKVQQSKVAGNFLFELLNCKLKDGTVNCKFMVTNKKADQTLSIHGRSRLYDDLGNEYPTTSAQIANSMNHLNNYRGVYKTIISGVPTRVTVAFEGFSPEATIITSLKIETNAGWIDFRNIPLTK